MTLIEKLKKALKDAGLKEGFADFVNIENESEIEGIVAKAKDLTQSDPQQLDFSEVIKSEDFNKFFEKHGFDGLLKLNTKLQSEHDKRVTKGIQTRLEKFLKTKGKGGNEEEENEEEMEEDDKMPSWAKTLLDKVEGFEKNQTTKSKREKAIEALSKSALPEKWRNKWLDRINLEEEDMEAQIKGLEEEYNDFHKDVVGSTSGRGLPVGGKVEGKVSEEDIEKVLEQMN